MYIPPHFSETRPEVLFGLIEQFPFGTLITQGAGGLDANHLPFHPERGGEGGGLGRLSCHVARGNPVWRELADGDRVLVVFQAGDAYISPGWYPSKHEHHRQVPTWNYRVVHAAGRVTVRDDAAFLRRNLAMLTRRHEQSQEQPWKMGDAPREYLDAMLESIVGLEIEITGLTGKIKLGQNKEQRDITGAGAALCARGEDRIGAAMLAAADAKSEGQAG